MEIISESTVIVYSSSELKDVLESNNAYNYIYFGSDINLTSGIKINKKNITIDGTYNGIMHTLTDQKKLGSTDGIYVSNITKNVTIKNMNITGYNYYGVIYVPENSNYSDTTIEYNGVNYDGCQCSYNPIGLTKFIDCYINIHDSYASGNEVAECNRVELGGFTIINHESTSNSSFWFRNSNPSLTILSDSNVHFTSENRELFYGVNNLKLVIEENALFSVVSKSGMGYSTYGTGEVLIDKNASLSISQTTRNGNNATWYSYGIITLNENSSLDIINEFSGVSSNYNIYFRGNNSGLILNNPSRFVLYNSNGNVINSQNNSTFNFTYDRINLFDKVIDRSNDISLNTLPTYYWQEENNISGIFNSNSVTILNNNSTNTYDNFNFVNKQIFSVGTFSFHVNAITDKDTTMSGITLPYASVLIQYNDVTTIIKADEEGLFHLEYNIPLDIGTKIKFNVKKYEDLLYYTKEVEVVYSGELVLDDATKYITFEPIYIDEQLKLCPRINELEIKIIDSRVNSTNWKLYASINHDLISESGKILKSSLVFVSDSITVLSNDKTLVYTGQNNEGNILITYVSWADNEGILLQLNDYLEINTKYCAEITWTLIE